MLLLMAMLLIILISMRLWRLKGLFLQEIKFYTVAKNECYKIMTGAKMPKNADTILMLEDECIEENKLIIKKFLNNTMPIVIKVKN